MRWRETGRTFTGKLEVVTTEYETINSIVSVVDHEPTHFSEIKSYGNGVSGMGGVAWMFQWNNLSLSSIAMILIRLTTLKGVLDIRMKAGTTAQMIDDDSGQEGYLYLWQT